MVQFLNSKSLLTSDESYWLMDTNRPWGKRVDFLVEILPRKERNWWDKFLWCLDESSARPGLAVHKELANQLRDQLNQQTIKYEVNTITGTYTYKYIAGNFQKFQTFTIDQDGSTPKLCF